MSRIGTPGIDPALAAAEASSRRSLDDREEGARFAGGELRGGLGDATRDRARHGEPFGKGGSPGQFGDRPFHDRVRQAMAPVGMSDAETPNDPDARLIAEAGIWPGPRAMLLDMPTVSIAIPVAAAAVDRVEALVARVEAALDAQLAGRRPEGLRLHLDLGDGIAGVAGLTVTLSPDTIEIVLARNTGALSPELVAAAQLLADRLQRRFQKRAVRIVETLAAEENPVSHGLDELARLFAERGSGT